MKVSLPLGVSFFLGIVAVSSPANDRDLDAGHRNYLSIDARAQHSVVYVPTQFYRTSEYTVYYGYKQAKLARDLSRNRDVSMEAPDATYIVTETAVSGKNASSWRKKVSNKPEAAPARRVKNRDRVAETPLSPVAERPLEMPIDGTASDEERVSRAGRMEPLDKLDDQIKNEPENAAAYYFRGSLLHDKWEYQRAIEDYDQAIKFDPKNAAAYYKRALCYTALNRSDLAIGDFLQANSLAPRNNRPWSVQSGEWSRQHGY